MEISPAEAARFWSRVDRRGPDDCWLWQLKPSAQGYGAFGLRGKVYGAHRVALTLAAGSIPEGLYACHTCDVRMCVNPAHLWAGTSAENTADMAAKGRGRGPNYRGEKIGTSKLTESDVREALSLIDRGVKIAAIGRRLGVTPQAISRIKSGLNWSWVRESVRESDNARSASGHL